MPAKKAAPKKAESNDMGMMWAWVYAIGLVVAGVAGALGFLDPNGILAWVLILAAVLVGLFYFDPDEFGQFGLRVLILIAVQAGLSAVPAVGSFITGFFGGWVFFLMPVVLAMGLRFVWNHRFAPLF